MKASNVPKPPMISNALEPIVIEELHDGDKFEQISVASAAITDADSLGLEFSVARIIDSEFSSSRFKKSTLMDVQLENCLLFGTNFDGSHLQRVAVAKGMFSGIVLSECNLIDVVFKGVKINLANFRVSDFRRVSFINCDLTDSDFANAELKLVSFTSCNLSGVEFSGCKMDGVEFSGSDLTTIKGISGLKGATIDLAQLISISQTMARELGIKLTD
jgi:uncharacterized protein YjbI with pentapeptide repeats